MVEKGMSEFGLMRWLDQGEDDGVRVCNLNVIEKKVNSEYVVENVLIRFEISLVGNVGFEDEDEGKDGIKGLIWVNNRIANKIENIGQV
ncbi:hypothetical protein Tco_1537899 [Tanacetum coccineum]